MAYTSAQDHLLHDMREPLNEQVIALLLENYHKFHVFVAQRVSSDAVADDLLQYTAQATNAN